MAASYAISVRQAGILLTASFRFWVAPDTLAVQLMVPPIKVHRGLALPSRQSGTTPDWPVLSTERHAWHTNKTAGLSTPGCYRF